ncbi:radical SAM protein [bacterium]|nr:radical SAM protein [bacterium]
MKVLFLAKFEYYEPLGMMCLSSFLKQHGVECFYKDIKFEKDLPGEIRKIGPDIIAYSITTGQSKFYQKLNLELKKQFKFLSIFGGPHCTFFPELINGEGVDIVCRGEGEYPMLELVQKLESGSDITGISNLWVKVDGKVYKNELMDLIEDLDSLPFPDRGMLDEYNHFRKMPRKTVMTGRGCPYKCTYCFNHAYNKMYKGKGKIVRKRSVDNVMKELQQLKGDYRVNRFQFWDDTFNIDRDWTMEFCEKYGRDVKGPFSVTPRVNLIDEEMGKALKDAGCTTIGTSLESGNEFMRNQVLKRNISEKQTVDACDLFNKYGLHILMGNMLGLPGETIDMAFETMELNIKCKPTYSWVSIFQPFPTTELSDYAIEKGYYSGNFEALDGSFFGRSALNMKDISEIERLHLLFSVGVAFPSLIPLIKKAIKFPFNSLYRLIFTLHKSWCYFTKLKYIEFSEMFIRR